MALTVTEIQQLYTAYLSRPADRAGVDYWQEQNVTAAELRANLANDNQPEYVELYGDRTRAELVEAIYQNMFGRAADEAGLDYWVNGEGAAVPASELQQLFIEAASAADRITFNDRVEADEAQIPPPVDNGDGGVEGETYVLTDGRDNLVGTENDDTFIGDAGQNQNGAVANAFATGDRIDGGAGRDKIEATLLNDSQTDTFDATLSINARTVNVEEVYLSVLDENVVVDGGRMDAVEQFWSDDSDASLVLEDIRLGTGQSITKDITFGMRDVDQQSGLSAAFESQSLTREAANQVNSSLLVRIADVSTETPATPLANVDLNLSFDLGVETVTLEGVRSTDGTYAGLVEALRNELEEAGYSDVNVNLSTPYSQVTVAGNTVTLPFTAQEILITDPAGNEFSNVNFTQAAIEPVADGFLVAGNAQPQDPASTSNVIETNLVLDNAGRGSTAGDAVIGGMSNSNTVIEKLNLIVDRNSKIADLGTATGMEGVGMDASGNYQGDIIAFNDIVVTSTGANGDLVIGNVGNVQNFDATAFEGENLSVTGLAGVGNTNTDVDANADDEAYAYNTGDSNDTLNITYSHDKATEFADYSLSINTGNGNDDVTLTSVSTGTNNLPDQQDLTNVTINTGAGDDVIRTPGEGAVLISAGAGNDTVYTDNAGVQSVVDVGDVKAHWVFNSQNDNINDLRGFAAADQELGFLPRGTLTVTYSGATTAGGGVTAAAAAGLTNGFEVAVDIDAGDDMVLTRAEYNAAIKQAINEDAVLSKLLVATDGPNNTLVIESLIDGEFAADDLDFTVASVDISDLSVVNQSEQNQIAAKYQEFVQDSDATIADAQTANADTVNAANGVTLSQATNGTDAIVGSASGNDNTGTVIDAGAGDDVVVLSTNAVSNETVEFNGSFGKVTIVNFEDDSLTTGLDTLDFTSYLATEERTSTSTSGVSQERIDTTVSADATLSANEILVVDFAFDNTQNSGQNTFEALTGAQLLAALNGDGDYGNLVGGTAASDNAAANFGNAVGNIVGGTQQHLVMVQNAANEGEYKVFQLTSVSDAGTNVDGGDFASATLVGTVDFGAAVDFTTVGIA